MKCVKKLLALFRLSRFLNNAQKKIIFNSISMNSLLDKIGGHEKQIIWKIIQNYIEWLLKWFNDLLEKTNGIVISVEIFKHNWHFQKEK